MKREKVNQKDFSIFLRRRCTRISPTPAKYTNEIVEILEN